MIAAHRVRARRERSASLALSAIERCAPSGTLPVRDDNEDSQGFRSMKTFMANAQNTKKEWHLVDATDLVLGRMATKIAMILMGKHRPTFTPHADAGDFVVVTNAAKIVITGRKAEHKVYRYHTQWVGNLKTVTYENMLANHPERIIALAVRRMLPKTKLGVQMFSKLKVYPGADHPHAAQQPKALAL
jgi:large subunit ribosomal protein L13